MFKRNVLLSAIFAFALFAVGCAGKPKESGFLSTYDNLKPAGGNLARYAPPGALKDYSKFIVDPVTTQFYDEKVEAKTKPEDRQHLEEFLHTQVAKGLSDAGYEVVSEPGPGVARIRLAITNLKKGNPAMNVLPQTKITGAGLGQASAEMEVLDSQSNKQIAAAVDSQTGSRFSLSGLSKWGDVEAVMKDWAKRIVKRIQEDHGVAAK